MPGLGTHSKTYIRLAVAHSKTSCMAAAASVNDEVDIVAEAGVLDSIKCLLGALLKVSHDGMSCKITKLK